MTTYKKGSQGDGVKDLQERLNNAGDYNLETDGIYGDETEAAVRDYQTKNNLKVDGIAGEETQGSLTGRSSGSVGKTDNSQSTPVSSVNTQPNLRQTAQSQLSALQKGYFNPLDETIDTLYDKIINQKQFEYDPFGDAAYNQYAEAYKRNAALMSEDAMAQAAALTGGYGSSYGQAVGTQAYNEQMTHLNDILPELRQNAYGEWQDARTREIEALSMLLNERDYERSIFESDRAFEESQRQYDENLRETQRQFDKNVEMEETQAKTDRDTLAIQAGFKSWDDYVKAVSSGEYNPNATVEKSGFEEKFLDGAIEAYQKNGEKGLTAYFDVYGDKYDEGALSELGEEIISGYNIDPKALSEEIKRNIYKFFGKS